MANTYRYGNNYQIAVFDESAYGTAEDSGAAAYVYPDKIEMEESIEQIDIAQKTEERQKLQNEVLAGKKSATAVQTGVLTDTHIGLIKGLLLDLDASSAFGSDTAPDTTNGYSSTIYQYFSDDKVNKLTSGVLESLEISGSSGEPINYTANYRGYQLDREEDESEGVTAPSVQVLTPFLFEDVSSIQVAGNGALDSITSFSLTLENSFAPDEILYNNNNQKTAEILCRRTGTLEFTWEYNSSHNPTIMNTSANESKFTLTDGTNNWAFSLYGKVSSYTTPDPDNCIFTGSCTIDLMGTSSHNIYTITTS